MKTSNRWGELQAKRAVERVEQKFGKDVRRVVAPEVYEALLGNEILLLVLTQELESYEAAQTLIAQVLRGLEDQGLTN
jgi:hypothetical protein